MGLVKDPAIIAMVKSALASGQYRNMTFEENLACKRYPDTASRRSALADHYRFLRHFDPALARRVYALHWEHSIVPMVPVVWHKMGNA